VADTGLHHRARRCIVSPRPASAPVDAGLPDPPPELRRPHGSGQQIADVSFTAGKHSPHAEFHGVRYGPYPVPLGAARATSDPLCGGAVAAAWAAGPTQQLGDQTVGQVAGLVVGFGVDLGQALREGAAQLTDRLGVAEPGV